MKKSFLKISVVNDTVDGTKVTTEDGTEIQGVQSVRWETSEGSGAPKCIIEFVGVGVEVSPGFLHWNYEAPDPEEVNKRAIELLELSGHARLDRSKFREPDDKKAHEELVQLAKRILKEENMI